MSATDLAASPSIFLPLREAQSRSDLVAESIKSAILSGRLKPGEMLVERRIAEELGVSKTPVREALIGLTRSGLLEVSRNRGASVRQLTFTEVRHVYEQRALLEPWAVASAVGASRSALDVADVALREAEQHAHRGQHGEHALANRRFHQALYRGCENILITRSLDALQDLIALAITGMLWETWPTWEEESKEHWAIQEAAVRGDGERAASLMRSHIEKSIARIRSREDGQEG